MMVNLEKKPVLLLSAEIIPRRAFTLVEVIAAAAILLLGLTFTSRAFVRSMSRKSTLTIRQSAHLLASSKIEEAYAGAGSAEGICSRNKNLFWTRRVSESDIPGMLEVEVAVSWTGGEDYFLRTLVRAGR